MANALQTTEGKKSLSIRQTGSLLASGRPVIQFCTFWLANRLFGVDILDVREINQEQKATPVFHAPPEVRGYVNIRGQVLLALDLRVMLGFPPNQDATNTRLVVFKPEVGESFGVVVDRVGDIVEATAEQIEEREVLGEEFQISQGKELILGECKLTDKLVILLNPSKFLSYLDKE
ncbi:MAG: chemotaxis protein CheW [Deltaproteobacteria bacterium]|nr:chemotaxis protein CheW [Deltaproteobacteria bacterium]